MPESEQSETPARRVGRQWYQMKIAERLMQASELAQNRALLRRGARLQQDGQLGQSGETAVEGEKDMNVSVGDTVNHHYHTSPEPQSGWKKAAAAALIGGALLGGGAGAATAWLMKPSSPAADSIDTDTTRRIDVEVRHAEREETDQ